VLFSSFICFSVILLYVLHRWDMSILLILLLSVSLLWMISARFLFKVELIFAGLLLFFVVFAAAQIEYMTSLPFWMMQFFWLPIAGGMIFFAYRWLNNLQSARFIFISGLIAFIGPECVTLFFADAPRWILQILLSLKLTTVASYLFLTRKEWRRFWIKEF
jgi:hypothetical protein